MSYRILTDSCCDLPKAMLQQLDVHAVPLTLNFRGQELTDTSDDDLKIFYDAYRAGESATTSAINPQAWKKYMEAELQLCDDLLVLAFSSGLSTTYQSAVIAAEELKESYPGRKIYVVDTLCASLGQGLLVWHTCKQRDAGLSVDELHSWVKQTLPNLVHWFTVDDLVYLKRGGRVSAATALLGTMLNIKPVLHVDDEGHLVSFSKSRGRKASIDAMAAKMASAFPKVNDTVFICHGDCLEDAEYLKKKVMDEYGVKEVFIGYTGAVIGSHSGPGTLALFFLGSPR